MKTIGQYRDDIRALMAKSAAVDEKATAENRDLTEAEVAYKSELLERVEEINGTIEVMARQDRLEKLLNAPEPPKTQPKKSQDIDVGDDNRTKENFKTFGQQLMAVRNASLPSGSIDPRLFKGAATGLGEAIPSDGGFLVQQDFSNELLQDAFATGQIVSKARKITLSSNANSIKINGVDETSRASTRYGGIIGYWIDEAATKTASKPKFRQITLNTNKLIGLCYATDELLQDASALGGFIRDSFKGEFGFLLDDSLINGSGAGQPLGVLNAGCLVSVAKEAGQAAATVVTENIVKMWARRFASQTGNYVWLYNQDIEPQLFTMSLSVGTGGGPVYMPPGGLSQAPYGTIMGRPAMAIEQCATLGTLGDIILANFSNGYITCDKGGVQSDVSIHVQFLTDQSVFRFVYRFDGQPVRASALTPYKGSNTQSHFIALATRA